MPFFLNLIITKNQILTLILILIFYNHIALNVFKEVDWSNKSCLGLLGLFIKQFKFSLDKPFKVTNFILILYLYLFLLFSDYNIMMQI